MKFFKTNYINNKKYDDILYSNMPTTNVHL